jgi:transcriptional regulator with XRE-family HTH domain
MSAKMISNDLVLLTQNIVRKRTLHGITQTEMAQAVGVAVGTLSRWESSNFKSTKISDLVRLLNYLESKGIKFCEEKNKTI